jgi:hypothetical protein
MHETEAGLLIMWTRMAEGYDRDATHGDRHDQAIFRTAAATLRLCTRQLSDTLSLRETLLELGLEASGGS